LDMTLADFDSVTYHVSTDAVNKNLLTVSISIKCFQVLASYGAVEVLKRVYGDLLVATEDTYSASVCVDCSVVPADPKAVALNVASLKRHCMAAPYYKAFSDVDAKKAGPLMEIRYRDEEAVYIKADADKCTVIFSINFRDKDDVVLAKVFLQEYADARRTLQSVPTVQYSQKEPPLELKDVKNLRVADSNGFVSFGLSQHHITASKRESTIDNIQLFRNYLHYHLKCSKAHIHARMRTRVHNFLQVLNRARSEIDTGVRRKMDGRLFTRADDPAETGD